MKKNLLKSIIQMLYPILRMCLRHSVRYQDISENLKLSFINAAQKELEELNDKISISKISAMTGINRKEVARLINVDVAFGEVRDVVTRVIGQWQSDKNFTFKSGKPKPLSIEGTNSDFFKLVKTISNDMAPYTILYELERLNLVKKENNELFLRSDVYAPNNKDMEEGFGMLGEDIGDFINAVENNLFSSNKIPNLHLKTEYTKIPVDKLEEVREWIYIEGSSFHHKVRNFLANYDLDLNPRINCKPETTRVAYCSFSLSKQKDKDNEK